MDDTDLLNIAALLIGVAIAVCVVIQLLVPGHWFSLILSIVATLGAWAAFFAASTFTETRFIVDATDATVRMEIVLVATLIALLVSWVVRRD